MKTISNPRFYGVFFSLFSKVVLILFTVFIIKGCEESNEIGLELIDSPVRMFSLDTLTVKAYTLADDSVATNFGSRNILGVIDDPVFGKTRASIYTETRLPSNNLSLGENPRLDSIFLVMYYTGSYYGMIEVFHDVKIYELSENFPPTDTLFSNIDIAHYPELINKNQEPFRLRPAPRDSVMVDTIMRPPHVRIPLSEAFGQKYIEANGKPAFENIPNYLEDFKGLFITLNENVDELGSLYSFNMVNPLTTIELYYTDITEEDTLSRKQTFPINEFSKRATRIDHFGYDHAHESLRRQVVEQEISLGDSLLFVQSLGRVRADVFFPYLDELAELPRVVINKAELVIPVQDGFSTEDLPEVNNLLLMRLDDDRDLHFISDYYVGSGYYGGGLDQSKKQYVFNISQYVQELLDGYYPNNGLALIVSGSSDNMSRVVLHGPGRKENPMRLVIHYSVFD